MKNQLHLRQSVWVSTKRKSKLDPNHLQLQTIPIDLKLLTTSSLYKNKKRNKGRKSKKNIKNKKRIRSKRKKKTDNTSIVIETIHKKKIKRNTKKTNTKNEIMKKNNSVRETDRDLQRKAKENDIHHLNQEAAVLIDY